MNCGMHHVRHRMCLDKARQLEQGKYSVICLKVPTRVSKYIKNILKSYICSNLRPNEIFHLSVFVFFKKAADFLKSTL